MLEGIMKERTAVVPFDRIASVIHLMRGQKVLLDRDLALLYGVPTKVLKQAVRRNLRRFPTDFMFELTANEFGKWRSQFVTSNADRMGLRYVPMAFTEQGVAMLSSVLNSQQAIEVNIAIMRAFVRMREFLASQAKLGKKLRDLEHKVESHHESIHILFEAIQQMISERPPAIGFHVETDSDTTGPQGNNMVKESRAAYPSTSLGAGRASRKERRK
jgi:hypothetical protein